MSEVNSVPAWRMGMGAWIIFSLVLISGVIASISVLAITMIRPQHSIEGLKAPGEHQLVLPQVGFHVLYLSFERTQDRRGVIRPEGHEQLEFTLSDASGKKITLEPVQDQYDYVLRYTRGKSMYGFDAPQSGTYQLIAEYPTGVVGQEVDLIIKQVFPHPLRDAFMRGGLVLLLTFLVAAVVCVFGIKTYKPETAHAETS